MAKYKVIKDINFGSGFTHDRTGKAIPMQSFAPKIGDIIELGELKEVTLWSSAPMKGYDFIVKQVGVTPDLKLFIKADFVEKVSSETPTTYGTSNNTKSTEAKNFFTPKNIIISLVVIGVIVGGLKLAKAF